MGRQTTTNEYGGRKKRKKKNPKYITNRKEGCSSSREDGPGLFMLWTWNARHVAQETSWVVERYKRKRTMTTTNRKCKTKEEDEREFPKLIERLHW